MANETAAGGENRKELGTESCYPAPDWNVITVSCLQNNGLLTTGAPAVPALPCRARIEGPVVAADRLYYYQGIDRALRIKLFNTDAGLRLSKHSKNHRKSSKKSKQGNKTPRDIIITY